MDKVYNFMFVGVGGQGSLLIAEITSIAATQCDYDVKQTEVHGVSQRGGSVETHIRFGKRVYSPMVTPGEADAVVSLEKLEALRFAHYVNTETGFILTNDYEIIPASVTNADKHYPYHAYDYLRDNKYSVITMSASQIAHQLGDGRIANVVMLGGLSTFLPLSEDAWQKSLKTRLPPRYLEINQHAFKAGQHAIQTKSIGLT
jgi:indolepyruvate ferredoxin oxidoreductase beta subunit